ncbi:MAG: hypothetical protein II008_02415 [Oscillospiraceae bacterium]|nr:hypothetical protein [Oscillospiraceae bacterium]
MTKAEEKRMEKAKALRYRKPAVKDLNLASIQEQLTEIEEACADVHWYCDSEDGWDTLLNALDGDDEEAWEFKLAFSDLEGECERMREDMDRLNEWDYDDLVGDHFDVFFAGICTASVGGGMWGFDEYEQDYFGLEPGGESEAAEREAAEKLKRLTKDKLISLMGVAFRIAVQFLGLRSRYADLKAAMDIIREQNTALLKQVKAIEDLYDATEAEGFSKYDFRRSENEKALDRLLNALPDRAWIE